jgi:hypothetical protein
MFHQPWTSSRGISRRETHGMQHAEPVDAVGGDQDVLADDVHRALVGGPEPEIRQSGIGRGVVSGEGDVVDERVEPDIGDEVGVEGDLDAPAQALFRAGNAQVGAGIALQALSSSDFAECGDHASGVASR